MGLFSSKECVLCGGKAGILTRFCLSDGAYICGNCRDRMSANIESVGSLDLSGVKEQIRLKEENDVRYRNEFSASRRIDLDSYHPIMEVDDRHGWFALLKDKAPDIFSFDQITVWNVDLHTEALSEEEKKDSSFLMDVLDLLVSEDFSSRYPGMPRCPSGCKVTGMYFEINFGPNPFGAKQIRLDLMPGWDCESGDIEKAYMCAASLDQVIREYKYGSEEKSGGTASEAGPLQSASSAPDYSDAVEQVKKFKELLDMGILTQEEFDKKKRELLQL